MEFKPVTMLSKSAKRGRELESNEGEKKKLKIEAAPLNLVDINEDCLEFIFQHLHIIDLINMAETDTRFIPAAVSVFYRCHRKKKVAINNELLTGDIYTIKTGMVTTFFHHFDQLISKLVLDFSLIDLKTDIEPFIQPYRLTSLVELELYACDEMDFDEFDGPFLNVEKLTITDSMMSENLSKLSVWFPNLVQLNLYGTTTMRFESLKVNYPKLKHLTIYHNKLEFADTTIREMVRLNPQLESLSLHSDIDENFLRSVEKYAQHLKILDLCVLDERFYYLDQNKIYFESVEKFSYTCDFVASLPFAFKNLQELKLQGFYLQLFDEVFKNQLLEFFAQNGNLVKLTLDFCEGAWENNDSFELVDVTMFMQSLPKLLELQLRADAFTPNEVIQFLAKNTGLKKVCLSFNEPNRHQLVRDGVQVLEPKWIITTHKCHGYDLIDLVRK